MRLALRARPVLRVLLVPKALQAYKAQPVPKVRKGRPGQPVPQAFRVPKGLKEHRAARLVSTP